jgi:hypothetical protein
VPLTLDIHPQVDEVGHVIVIDDTLACLAQADCGRSDTPSIFSLGDGPRQDLYDAAFDAWTAAREHIRRAWMHNADPANLTVPVPAVMRAAARLVRKHGPHLGARQDELTERLEAPYAARIQRAIRAVLIDETLSTPGKATRLLGLADQLGLTRQPAPEPLQPITTDDIHLICWTAIVPADP